MLTAARRVLNIESLDFSMPETGKQFEGVQPVHHIIPMACKREKTGSARPLSQSWLQARWAEGIAKNQEIDSACQQLEVQIKEARERQAAAVAQAATERAAAPPLAESVTASSSPQVEGEQSAFQHPSASENSMSHAADGEVPVAAVAASGESGPSAGSDVLREHGAGAGEHDAGPKVSCMLTACSHPR